MEIDESGLQNLISQYEDHVLKDGMKEEAYKWMLLERYRGRPDPSAADFNSEFRAIKFENLLYPISLGVLRHIAKDRPQELADAFRNLFNENRPLQDRIANYIQESKAIYEKIEPGKSAHQDERTASVLLAYHAPDRYPLYKDSFYNHFCGIIGTKPRPAGSKYVHFVELLTEFIRKHIERNRELIELVRSHLPPNAYADPSHLLLAQDILYCSSTKGIRYWLFQCNPDQYDLVAALNSDNIDSWTVTSHRDSIRPGDRAIVWMTGEEAGCYALAEVTEAAHERPDASSDAFWKETGLQSDLVVGIEVTHNLADRPVFWELLRREGGFEEIHRGQRGTNFSAKPGLYEAIVRLSESERLPGRAYWLIAPGQGGGHWAQFINKGIAAIDWPLGDLRQYADRDAIRRQLQASQATVSSKKNDTNACWEFTNVMKPGDVIIAKRGRGEFLGWGIVTSEYKFAPNTEQFPHTRDVNWIKQGPWPHTNIVLKTLTNVTQYKDYVQTLSELMGINEYLNSQLSNMTTNHALNTILYGPPGTGKTYHTISKALEIMGEATPGLSRKEQKEKFQKLQEVGRIAFVTFHQSMSYEDFVEGIKPVTVDEKVLYQINKGIFRQICEKASEAPITSNFDKIYSDFSNEVIEAESITLHTPVHKKPFSIRLNSVGSCVVTPQTGFSTGMLLTKEMLRLYVETGVIKDWKPYTIAITNYIKSKYPLESHKTGSSPLPHLLIIDEINRGNVSQIFGELITLIEKDKRAGNSEALTVTLPYSKETFSVPNNLFIIGTMNTADRSVEALDTALRRRFEFEEMPPRPDKLREDPENVHSNWLMVNGYRLCDLLHTLNRRIEKLLDRDHCIGHAYFINVRTLQDLQGAFQHSILPLLQEYFYGDYGKIGLVLGKGFVSAANADRENADEFFAEFHNPHRHDLVRREVWHLEDVGNMSEEAFLSALKSMNIKPLPQE